MASLVLQGPSWSKVAGKQEALSSAVGEQAASQQWQEHVPGS